VKVVGLLHHQLILLEEYKYEEALFTLLGRNHKKLYLFQVHFNISG